MSLPRYHTTVNGLVSHSFSSESATEPVTLAELKTHLKITHTDDDGYLTPLIKQARSALEKFTGLSLISRTVTAVLNNGAGSVDLPFGPVTSFTSMANKNGDAITSTDYKIYGEGGSQYIETPISDFLRVVYVAGYTNLTIPDSLKLAVLKEAAWHYVHRGDEDEVAGGRIVNCAAARSLAGAYSKNTWLV